MKSNTSDIHSDGNPDHKTGPDKNCNSRRKLITVLAGSGAVASGFAIPAKWTRPVVESLIVPAHADTSSQGPSDARLKEDIELVSNIGSINFYRWNWNSRAQKVLGLTGASAGVIAQEVAGVLPEIVGRSNGYLSVDYRKLIATLLGR